MIRSALVSAGVVAATLLALTPAAQAATPTVQITRIWYDSPGSPDFGANASLNGEYVQLKNVSRKAIALKGWTVRDATKRDDHIYRFGTFTLGAGKTVTLRTGRGTNTVSNRYWGRSGGTLAYIWNQVSDTGYVRDASGKLRDSCSYNSGAADFKNC